MTSSSRRRFLHLAPLLAVGWLGAVGHAAAADEKKKPGKEELSAIDLAAVGLPIVQKGRLVNYVFAYVRLNTRPGADVIKARAKEPYFRDALIRLAHRRPFTDAKDLNRVDEAALRAALLPEAQRIAGSNVVTGVVVVSQQPQHRLARPVPPGPPAGERAPVP